jgi:hypothetical protein
LPLGLQEKEREASRASVQQREKQLQFSPLLLARERGKKSREKKKREGESEIREILQ